MRRAAYVWALAGALVGPASLLGQVDGKAVYDKWCAGCHGVEGRGDGPGASAMLPRPRDFTLALYQIRSTATGELPTDADILHVIDVGMPGTAMPGWEDVLTEDERLALVTYLKTFSRFFEGAAPTPMEFGGATGSSEERIVRGREVYETIECYRCHGDAGRGDGESSSTLDDDGGFPIVAADLTENWLFNGGSTVEDIYRRLRTGLDGTPMPTFSDLVAGGVVTDDDLWSLAHYVRSLSPETAPVIREVVEAERTMGVPLPTTVDDPAWAEAEAFYVALVGQIVVKPRWFGPRVDGIWVKALHDGQEVAMLVSWTDPSRSPDPEWADFGRMVIETVGPDDEGAATDVGGADQLVVQFPQAAPEGMERPFFLQGDTRRPAYVWTWRSDAEGAVEGAARGLGTSTPQAPGDQQVTAVAQHADGQWKVLFRRALDTGGMEDLVFPEGQTVPVAFQAWDGDNGESGRQGAVSTWYFLALKPATPLAVYVTPPLALALTLGFGLLVIRRAQRGAGSGARDERNG